MTATLPIARPAALVLLALIAGCGPVKRINPPAATVQRLEVVAPGGAVQIELRLHNHSDVTTTFDRFDGTLALGGGEATPLAVEIGLDVPAHAAEVVRASVAAAALPLDRPLRYRLDGRIATREPRGSYPVEYESTLSPVPGRPGEFR